MHVEQLALQGLVQPLDLARGGRLTGQFRLGCG
jgi:hypothetical protein